ncbi:MAG: hypothetical protein R3E97_08770 [Candidatus Eisenbacteria bacterium]
MNWKPVLGWLAFVVLAGVVVTSFVHAQGLFGWTSVHVEDEDVNLHLHVPSALARVAIAFIPDRVWDDARDELGPWRSAMDSAFEQLDHCEDATFVLVESGDETVRVGKRGARFIVAVETPSEQVDVRVPAGLVRAVWGRIADEPRRS